MKTVPPARPATTTAPGVIFSSMPAATARSMAVIESASSGLGPLAAAWADGVIGIVAKRVRANSVAVSDRIMPPILLGQGLRVPSGGGAGPLEEIRRRINEAEVSQRRPRDRFAQRAGVVVPPVEYPARWDRDAL